MTVIIHVDNKLIENFQNEIKIKSEKILENFQEKIKIIRKRDLKK